MNHFNSVKLDDLLPPLLKAIFLPVTLANPHNEFFFDQFITCWQLIIDYCLNKVKNTILLVNFLSESKKIHYEEVFINCYQ